MFRKYRRVIFFLLWFTLLGNGSLYSQTAEDTVLEYFTYFVAKNKASIKDMCRFSDARMEYLMGELDTYFRENIYIGVSPVITNVCVENLKATVLVDVKVALYADMSLDEDIDRQEYQTEHYFQRMVFDLETSKESSDWVITNVYSKELSWPVPAACERRLVELSREAASQSVIYRIRTLGYEYGGLPEINNLLGLKYISLNDRAQAMMAFQKVLDVEPNNYFANALLADLLYKTGDKVNAGGHALRSLLYCPYPENPNFHAMIGYVLIGSENMREGADQFQKYLARQEHGTYSKNARQVLDEIERIQSEFGSLEVTIMVDGHPEERVRSYLYLSGGDELVNIYTGSRFTANDLFPGNYDLKSEIRGSMYWFKNIQIDKSARITKHVDLMTGRIHVSVLKTKGLPFLDTIIYLMRSNEVVYIDKSEDYQTEFIVLPGVYDILIKADSGKAQKKYEHIEVKDGKRIDLKYNFDYRKVSVSIVMLERESFVTGYVFGKDETKYFLEKFDGKKADFYLPIGRYELLLTYDDIKKLIDFEVEIDIQCDLQIVLD